MVLTTVLAILVFVLGYYTKKLSDKNPSLSDVTFGAASTAAFFLLIAVLCEIFK